MQDKYIISARKYRPSNFASVVGQQTLTRTLRNAIDSNRLAQAYLFCGPRGVGKTSCARIFAKTINCTNRTPDGEACGECESCRDFQKGASYNVIELDAASNNGVSEMKTLIDQVNVPPQTGRYRVFIIDEVHMLSTQAFNAFLKTLEEPPSYAIFIMATTEKNKVLPTILSRCQIFDFSRITDVDISNQLAYVAKNEHIEADPLALDIIARKADGAMRDALSIFDQVAASSENKITYQSTLDNLNILDFEFYFRFVDIFNRGNVNEALLLYREIRDKGFNAQFFINGLAEHIRNLMVALSSETQSLLEVAERLVERYKEQARLFQPKWYYQSLKILSDADLNYRVATDKQLLVELTLIRLCQLNGIPAPPTGSDKPQLKQPATQSQPAATRPSPSATRSAPSNAAAETGTAPPIPAPVVKNRGAARAHHISPSQSANNVQENNKDGGDSKDDDNHKQQLNTPITPESLQKAWHDFISSHPKEKNLAQAMQNIPEKQPDGSYLLTVAHQGLAYIVENNSLEICSYIRKALGNESFILRTKIEETPHTIRLQPRELLQQMVSANPDLHYFIKTLGLELE